MEKSRKVNVTLDRIERARERERLFWTTSPVWETATQEVAAAGHHSDTAGIFNSSMISSVILLRADRSITGLRVVCVGQTRTVSHLLLALRQSMVIFLCLSSESVVGTPLSRATGSDGSAVSPNQVPCHSDTDMKTHRILKSASQSGWYAVGWRHETADRTTVGSRWPSSGIRCGWVTSLLVAIHFSGRFNVRFCPIKMTNQPEEGVWLGLFEMGDENLSSDTLTPVQNYYYAFNWGFYKTSRRVPKSLATIHLHRRIRSILKGIAMRAKAIWWWLAEDDTQTPAQHKHQYNAELKKKKKITLRSLEWKRWVEAGLFTPRPKSSMEEADVIMAAVRDDESDAHKSQEETRPRRNAGVTGMRDTLSSDIHLLFIVAPFTIRHEKRMGTILSARSKKPLRSTGCSHTVSKPLPELFNSAETIR